MSEAAEAPERGSLSLDEAAALLDRREEARAAGETGELDFEGVARAPEEDDVWDQDPDGEAEDEAEAAAPGEVDRLEPPSYWSQDAKARFAELDPDLQAVVLAQEGPREDAAAEAKAEAAQVRAAALQEVAQVRELAAELSRHLPQMVQDFAERWGEPDWPAFAQAHGVEAMSLAKAEHEAQKAQLERASQLAAEAERRGQQAYVAHEFERLKALDPELADPVGGEARRTEVTHYLHGCGVTPGALFHISALELSLARKAMLWDRAQAKAGKPAFRPRPVPPAGQPLSRGGASAGTVDPKARSAAQARSRFAKSRSVEDAVALLNAQGD